MLISWISITRNDLCFCGNTFLYVKLILLRTMFGKQTAHIIQRGSDPTRYGNIKKVLAITALASVIVSSVPFSASAESLMEEGNIDGYDYELYNQNCSGEFTMEPKAGSFIISWKDIELCMASIGKKYDLLQKNGKDMENVSFSYDLDFSPCGDAYFGAYGRTQDPSVEYHIIEGWNEHEPPSVSNNLLSGTAVINGNEYDVFMMYRINQPGLDGTETFPQYWSVRKENAVQNNTDDHIEGAIDISKHFASWEAFGFDTSGALYEAMFFVEGYRSSGTAELKKLNFEEGQDSSPLDIKPNKYYNTLRGIIDDDGYYYKYDLDNYDTKYNNDGWSSRENANLRYSPVSFEGIGSLRVIDRNSPSQGPCFPVDKEFFFAGDAYSLGAVVMQNEAASADFALVMEYTDADGCIQREILAEASAPTGKWTELFNTSFAIPESASDFSFFIETPDYTGDFYVDDAYEALENVEPFAKVTAENAYPQNGDLNRDGVIDVFDLSALRRAIIRLVMNNNEPPANSDANGDGIVNVADLVYLQRYLLGAPTE